MTDANDRDSGSTEPVAPEATQSPTSPHSSGPSTSGTGQPEVVASQQRQYEPPTTDPVTDVPAPSGSTSGPDVDQPTTEQPAVDQRIQNQQSPDQSGPPDIFDHAFSSSDQPRAGSPTGVVSPTITRGPQRPATTQAPTVINQPSATQSPTTQPPARDPFEAQPDSAEPTVTLPAPAGGYEPTVSFDAPSTAAPVKPKRRIGRKLAAGGAVIALAAGAGFGGAYLYDERDDSSSVTDSLTSSDKVNKDLPKSNVTTVAEKLLPSVVNINVSASQASGSGTGIIMSEDGNILTNNHVIDAAKDSGTITVGFSDGTNSEAKVVGTDPIVDLAVIKVEGKSNLVPAQFGSSSDLRVGQEVVAIGSPYGLESTVTEGIISALNRPVSTGQDGEEPTIFPAVQTDAAINPGNSGGPLVNVEGQVIGINSAIRAGTTTSGEAGSIGLGFAIPIDLAKSVGDQLLQGKKVEHAQIGVTVKGETADDKITGIGARISVVTPGSAGAEAGLKPGDVITAVDGHPVATNNALVASIRAYQPGQKVTLTVQRDDKTEKVDVTLGSDADEPKG